MINGITSVNPTSAIGGIVPGGGVAGPSPQVGMGDGESFGSILSDAILKRPSASQSEADQLAAAFAAGDDVDPHQLALASAKAGVEIQMSTRTISQAVTAVRTLFQMQI